MGHKCLLHALHVLLILSKSFLVYMHIHMWRVYTSVYYLDANVHRREARKGDLVGGNLPQNDSETVHVSRSLVNVLRPMLQGCTQYTTSQLEHTIQ